MRGEERRGDEEGKKKMEQGGLLIALKLQEQDCVIVWNTLEQERVPGKCSIVNEAASDFSDSFAEGTKGQDLSTGNLNFRETHTNCSHRRHNTS